MMYLHSALRSIPAAAVAVALAAGLATLACGCGAKPTAKPRATAGAPSATGSPSESGRSTRLEPFVAASRAKLERLKSAPGRVLFAAERADAVESVDKPAEDDGSFRFTSLEKGKDFCRMELEARHVGRPLPEGALAFPDVKQLAADVPLKEIDASIIAAFAALLRDGPAWMAKMVFAVGPDVPDRAKAMAPGADWDVLRRRDKELGATYRAALARQGVKLRTYEVQPD
jgi:hypothetical protein